MIEIFYETNFELIPLVYYVDWLDRVIVSENVIRGDINYIFCDDSFLLDINQRYLNHDTLTDIITFDYSQGKVLNSDVYISIDRVKNNARTFNENFQTELLRVMSHGILHLCGYNDKNEKDRLVMRDKEEEKIRMFHVEQS